MMAQEAALKEIANSGLRRLLAFNKSPTCPDVKIGDTALSYMAQKKKCTPRRRGPVLILDIDEAGVTVKFQPQISEVARLCVGKRGEKKDVEEAELDPARARFRQSASDLGDQLGPIDVGKDMEVDREDGNPTLCTGAPESGSGPRPEMIPVPDSPSMSVQLPTSRDPLIERVPHLKLQGRAGPAMIN